MGTKNGVCRLWLVVALFSIPMAVPTAGAQERSKTAKSNPQTSETKPQQVSENEKNRTQASQKSVPEQSTKARREASGGDDNAQFKNSDSIQWMARKLRVSTATAYGLSIVLNFFTIVAVVVLLLRSKLPALFRNRTRVIRQSLDEARKASAEAQQRLSAIESRLGKLQAEIAEMQSAADQESKAEEERIRVAAGEEKRRIAEAAEQEIAAAVSLAKRDFKAYAAELAVTLAANSIQVDASTDEALLRSFVDQLGRNRSN
jgi:F-type H+-transporting ATPase subunit b